MTPDQLPCISAMHSTSDRIHELHDSLYEELVDQYESGDMSSFFEDEYRRIFADLDAGVYEGRLFELHEATDKMIKEYIEYKTGTCDV